MISTAKVRHTRPTPCPVCHGYDEAPRGDGSRCYGLTSGDYAHCTREEHGAGCEYNALTEAYVHYLIGLCNCGVNHLGTERPSTNGKREIVATYDYHDVSGDVLFQVVRFNPKGFSQRRPDGNGGYIPNLQGINPVIYHLPEILAAPMTETVFDPEGEKDADRLRALGLIATTSPMGAKKWRAEYSWPLKGRNVVIIEDNDKAGQAHALDVAAKLQGVAKSIKILRLPDLPDEGDVSDWLDAGHTADELAAIIKTLPEYEDTAPFSPASTGDTEGIEWGAPAPFDVPVGPEFPVDALPVPLREYVFAEADAIQVDATSIATAALVAVSIAALKRFEIDVNHDWHVQPNLYAIIAMASGERKSRVERAIFEPIRKYQREQIEDSAPRIENAKFDREVLEGRITKAKTAIAKHKVGTTEAKFAREDAQNMIDALALLPEPGQPRLLMDNWTPEALMSKLSEHEGVMGLSSTEGGQFAILAGLYTGGTVNMDVLLKAYEGDTIIVDRVGRPSEIIAEPLVSMLMMVQPSIVREAGEKRQFRERGLFARFLWAFPRSKMGYRTPTDKWVAKETRQWWDEALRSILELHPVPTEFRTPLWLDDDAATLFTEYRAKVEAPLRPGGEFEGVQDWAARLPATSLKIACALHLLEHAHDSEAINVSTLRNAIRITEFYTESALLAFQTIDHEGEGTAKKLAIKILEKRDEGRFSEGFSIRDLYQMVRRSFESVDDLKNVLATLDALNYVTELRAEAGKFNKGARFAINPNATLDALRTESE